jgi:hypothetical protein
MAHRPFGTPSTRPAGTCLVRTAALLGVVMSLGGTDLRAQYPAAHVVVPSLANATHPSDLDFQGGECDLNASGRAMTCLFQQVFLTVAPFDAQTCLVTTNSYERTFDKESDTVWVSRSAPDGDCGVVDVATLRNEGGPAQWSLELRKSATKRDMPACRAAESAAEVMSWRNARRPLPCRFVQPGAVR